LRSGGEEIPEAAMKQASLGVCSIVMAACASQSAPMEEVAACSGLSQPFSPPFFCPIKEDVHRLKIDTYENACFVIEREPGAQGGLRIPRQIVCPPFKPTG